MTLQKMGFNLAHGVQHNANHNKDALPPEELRRQIGNPKSSANISGSNATTVKKIAPAKVNRVIE